MKTIEKKMEYDHDRKKNYRISTHHVKVTAGNQNKIRRVWHCVFLFLAKFSVLLFKSCLTDYVWN